MKNLTKLFILLVFSISALSTQAQTVDEILTNYFENTGGVDNWKKVKSMKSVGKMIMKGPQEMTFPGTVYQKAPNLQRSEYEIMGKQMVEAYDGTTGWKIDPFQGGKDPQKMTEEESTESGKQKLESEFIDYKEKGNTVELMGKEEIDGAETFKVKLVTKAGDESFYFFDTENYVPIMVRTFAAAGQMKGQTIDTYLSDYDEVEGLMMPHTIENKFGEFTMQIVLEEIKINVELEDDFFDFPAAVVEETKGK